MIDYGNQGNEKEKKAVTRETTSPQPAETQERGPVWPLIGQGVAAQGDGGKGVPATRRPNRIGLVGAATLSVLLTSGIAVRYHTVLYRSGTVNYEAGTERQTAMQRGTITAW